jgi:outer membrane protein TolC
MLTVRLKTLAALVLVVSVLGVSALVSSGVLADEKSSSASSDAEKLKELQKERRDVLEKLLSNVTLQYKSGAVPISGVAQAERDFLRAALDVEDDGEKRTVILKEHQKNVEAIVRIAEGFFKNGVGTEADVLQAKAILLESRIELLREQQKAKSSK